LSFLDEDDPYASAATEPPDRLGPPDRDRQILVRRLIAVAAGLLILVLLILGVRGCLDARKEREFENFVSDLNSLVAESQQLSEGFFARLNDPENLSELEFEAEVKADRGAAEGLVDRAQNLTAPSELKPAQADLVLAFELRRDGLTAISDEIGTALGDEGSEEAIAAIAEDMQYFVASDVLYRRAKAEIDTVLAEQGIRGEAPQSQFLPDIDWLDETTVAEALAPITGEDKPTGGVHGLGLVVGGTVLQPGDIALTEGTPVTAPAEGDLSLDVQVENQGDSAESDVLVTAEVDGSEAGEATIDTIEPGAIETAEIPLDFTPSPGDTVTIDVLVTPVPGEEVADNNEASFDATFE
jgi:CARDB